LYRDDLTGRRVRHTGCAVICGGTAVPICVPSPCGWWAEAVAFRRDNHARVEKINSLLKAAGMRTWFDADRMEGDIARAMTQAIDSSAVVVCFVTRNYLGKVAGEGAKGLGDACKRNGRGTRIAPRLESDEVCSSGCCLLPPASCLLTSL
jgi:hypothetical protein